MSAAPYTFPSVSSTLPRGAGAPPAHAPVAGGRRRPTTGEAHAKRVAWGAKWGRLVSDVAKTATRGA